MAGGPYRDANDLFWHDSPPEEKRVPKEGNTAGPHARPLTAGSLPFRQEGTTGTACLLRFMHSKASEKKQTYNNCS